MKSKLNFRRLLQLCTVTLAFNAPSSYGVTDTFNTAGTFNWVCPGGVTSIQVECWGGGGAGGAGRKDNQTSTNSQQNGGGGGGGAYARRAAVPVTPGQTYTVTIPAAAVSGSAGTTTNAQGRVNGGTVTFVGNSSITVTAAGGTGGANAYVTGSNTVVTAGGGVGGTTAASVGDVGAVFAGGAGATSSSGTSGASGSGGGGGGSTTAGGAGTATTASVSSGTPVALAGGAGGSIGGGNGGSGFGAGSVAGNASAGGAGVTPGGGGGGGHNVGQNTRLGGTGGLGQISLTYTVPPNFKADNTDNLDQASSWTAFLPNAGNIAEWNNLVTGANTTSLGTDLSLAGIKISNPAGPVTINAGNILTLGAAATDLDLSTATQDLTLNCDLTMGAANVWNVASGRTLTLGGAVSGAAPITKQGTGTATLAGAVTHTGATTVSAGAFTISSTGSITTASNIVLTVSGASAVANIEGTYNSTGGGGVAINTGGILNTSGTVTISGANNQAIFLGTTAGSGTWNVTGGSVSVNYASNGWGIGNTGTGTLNVSAGSVTTAGTNVFNLGHGAGGTGILTISGTGLVTVSAGTGAFNMGVTATSTSIVNLNGGTLALGRNITKNASSTATFNFNGGLLQAGLSSATYMNGLANANVRDGGAKIDTNNFNITIGQALVHSVIGGDAAIDGGLTKSGLGTLTLSGTSTFTGATVVSGGTLALSGTGGINSSSDITINGSDANLNQASSVALSPIVTVTQGTLTGSGTVNTVNVGAGTGGIISNNNGVAGASLTVGALTFNGAATINTFGNAAAPILTTTLATNAAGLVTINPSAATWAVGTPHDLITYGGGSIGGAGFSQFQLGAVIGASPRQTKTLGNSGTAITLTIGADDVPVWVGDGDGKWNLASTNNWKLVSNSSYTTFLTGDNALFNDSASGAGPIALDIDTANVAPTSTTFNNSTKNYTLGSTGGFGISAGSLTKSGTGTLTITNANTYTGNTVINGGVLDISTDGAQLYNGLTGISAVVTVTNGGVLVLKNYGQANTSGLGSPSLGNLNNSGGQVVLDGGTLRFNNETGTRGRKTNIGSGGGTIDVVNNSTLILNNTGTFLFSGADTLTLTGDATSTGTIEGVIAGTDVTLVKNGAATWTLSATNTFTGNTTISQGILAMSGNRIPNSPTIFIGNGATLRSTGAFILSANQAITSTGATGNVLHSAPGTINFQTTSGTAINAAGTLTISRLDVRGAGNVIATGSIFSGGAAAGQRGLLVGNTVTGELTINSGASLTTGASGSSAQDIFGVGAGITGTLIINGGTYTNTSGLAALQLGNNTGNGSGILTINSGSASIGTIIYQPGASQSSIVNLNGGTLTLAAMTSIATGTREFNFDGGQFVAGGGVTFPAEVTAYVKDGGAKIDTNGFSATVASPMLNNGTGGLIKSGLGTLTLSGVNTYVGGTSVTGGSLRFSTAAASVTDVTVSGGAEAGALVAVNNGQWVNTGNLTLLNNGAALVDYGSTVPSLTVAPVSITNFVNGTTPGVRLAGAALSTLTVGQTLPLITWTGTGPMDGSAFDLRTHRLSGTFSVASNTLSLTITKNAIGPIAWNTGNGNWNTATANWLDEDLIATTYVDALDAVTFGDAAGVSGNPVVTLATTVSPVGTVMNTTGRSYTVSGAGSISGSGALTLDAANLGTFTLATANNTFSGGTVINGGTLVLGSATNTLPDTGAVTVDGATSILSLGANSDTVGAVSLRNGASITGSGTLTGSSYALESGMVSAILGGTGALTKNTTSNVTLASANTYTGNTTVNAGTLVLADTAALQSTALITMASGTTLHFATDTAFPTLPLVGGSSGTTGTIFISDRATPGAGLIHSLGTPSLGNNSYNFTKGANVTSGTAGFAMNGLGLTAGAAGTTVLYPIDATLSITGLVNIPANSNAKTLALSGENTGNEISGSIANGINTLSLSKLGTGTWTISGVNSYTGATNIDQGTLIFATTDQTLTGGLVFGAAIGSANVGTLNLSNTSATFGGALTVQTNSVNTNSILVGSGKTLTLSGGLTMSNNTDAAETRMTMTGGGSLVVNGASISIGNSAGVSNISGESHLDLSALNSFTATLTTTLTVQAQGDNSNTDPSSLTLSNVSNSITSPAVRVGNSATGSTNRLWLGAGTNTIQTDLLNLGVGSRDSGVIDFAGTGGTVSLRNQSGTGRVANVNLGPAGAQTTGYTTNSFLDFTGNTADVAIGTYTTSQGAKTAANTNEMRFDSGILDIRTINMAVAKGTGASTNRIIIGGGTVRLGGSTEFTDAGTGTLTLATAGSGELIINGGTVTATASIVKGSGGTGTATITQNGGSLDMSGNGIGTATDTVVLATLSGTLSNVAEVNGGGAWTKSGTGTLILAGTNTYTGTATVNGGTLSITGTLSNSSSLAVGGGTVSFSGAAPQTVSGLTINAGSSTVTNTNAGTSNVLDVGAIIRNPGGVVNFANATASNNVIQTSTANTNGILGPWAFVGADFAMNDGSGKIVAYNGYSDVTRLSPGVIADGATTNVRIVEGSGSPGNITLGAPITTINSLLQSDSGGTSAATINVGASTLSTDAIVMTTVAGTLTVGTAPNSGILTPATAGGDLVLTNNSAGNPMTINSVVADNTTASALIKTGVGTVILSGTNTYTGTTTVNGGTLRLGGSVASATALVSNGTLQTGGNLPVTAVVTLSGTSTLDLFGTSQTVASLANTAGNILTNSSTSTHDSTASTPGSPALTDALTITGAVTANSLPLLVTDGPTRKTQVVLNNANGTNTNFLTNNANTFSGGVVLAHNATNGTRLTLNGTNAGIVGTGPIIIGQANTDKAGVFISAAASCANDLVFNTALGTDRVGLRADAAVTLSGKITANLAPATFTSNSATGGNVIVTGQVTGASGLVLDITSLAAAATNFNVTLNNAGTPNDYAGDTVINLAAAVGKSAILNLGAAEQIPHGAATGNVVINSNGTGAGTLNLAGFSETINGLSGNGSVDGASGTPTLTLGANNASASFSGVISNTTGTLALVKTGTGTQTLSGANTYTGTTSVSQGTLAFIGGSLISPITVSAGASLSFDVGATTTSTSSVDITVGTIKITGTPSAASHTLFTAATGITGTPVLAAPVPGYELKVVGNSLVLQQAGYGSWAALNSAGPNLNDDHDNDGVANGVEYFLGGPSGNTSGFTALPGVTNTGGTLTVTWVMGSGYAGVYGTHFTVETSETLTGAWTTETSGVNVVVSGSNVTYTFPAPLSTKRFARLKVTGP